MSSLRQSICWGGFCRDGLTPETVVRRAVEIGYRGVEMVPQEHWGLLADHGLQIATTIGHASLPDGLNNPANHTRIEDELRGNLELAVAHEIPNLICFSGNRSGRLDEEGRDHCIAGLRRVAGAAEKSGVNLCLELLNSKVDHPDYQCDRTTWGVEVCRGVDSPRVKLLYDIYHMQIMEGDLIRTIEDNAEYIAHYHTAGNQGRHDLDETQEIYYPAVMRAIAGTGYQGYVGQEFTPKGDPLAAMAAAFRTCDVSA